MTLRPVLALYVLACVLSIRNNAAPDAYLDFAQIKRRKRGGPPSGGTERRGIPACRGCRLTVRNLLTPARGADAPGRWHPRRSAMRLRRILPGDGGLGDGMMLLQRVGGQGGPGEEAQQDGRGASDGQVGPLAFGFRAQMSARFLKGDFPPEADQRRTNHSRIWAGSTIGSVQRRPRVRRYPRYLGPVPSGWSPSAYPNGTRRRSGW